MRRARRSMILLGAAAMAAAALAVVRHGARVLEVGCGPATWPCD